METENGKKPLVIIAGPTASGKSALSVWLAKRLCGSVISADSMQVYHDMAIGSARITPEEMQGIPHYLVDCIDPTELWNVVRFQQEAKTAYQKIREENRIPILAGGTGFYIQSFLYDIDFSQMPDRTDYRSQLEKMALEGNGEQLYRLLVEKDPASAQAIHPNNIKRVIRALEFLHESGECISGHNEKERARISPYTCAYFVLTMDRQRLYERIDKRVDQMFADGLVEEVASLRARGLTISDVSMQGLGYRQLFPYLDGEISLEEAAAQIKTQTRHFAKRQLTWFRREEQRSDILWVDLDRFGDIEEAGTYMMELIERKIS